MHYVARHNVTDIDSAQHSAAQHARPMHDRSVQRVHSEFRSVFVHESKANAECHNSCDDGSVGHATRQDRHTGSREEQQQQWIAELSDKDAPAGDLAMMQDIASERRHPRLNVVIAQSHRIACERVIHTLKGHHRSPRERHVMDRWGFGRRQRHRHLIPRDSTRSTRPIHFNRKPEAVRRQPGKARDARPDY